MARVAALQFASGCDLDTNLETCLRVIDRAADHQPVLMVLPEFSNHISWYDDAAHAWVVALELEGEFLAAIAARAARYDCYIIVNVSLRRTAGQITVSSLCYGPAGDLLSVTDKQTLMGHENTWFARATEPGDVLATPFGNIAMFPCRDGVTCETPRGLALRGAQLFCDSLNSFALDEASLHVPARAPENKVFLVAANKVGPLVPEAMLDVISEQAHIPRQFLMGAGESQIVSPDGEVIARAPRDEEAVVYADIDLALSLDKSRPDGTDLFKARRPQLYREVVEPSVAPVCADAAENIRVALLTPRGFGEGALSELHSLVGGLPADTRLAVLPELFCYEGADTATFVPDSVVAEAAIKAMRKACAGRENFHLCASLVLPVTGGFGIVSVLVDENGVKAQQPQLHVVSRYPWMYAGEKLDVFDLPWGRLGMITGDDMVFPELVKVAALRGCHVIASPLQLQERWEEAFGLRSRSAENRVCLLASSRALSARCGLVADLERDFTLMTHWEERKFDGYINTPIVTEQLPDSPVTLAEIHPAAASNKLMSESTDLLLDRPWRLSSQLVEKGRA